MTGPLNGAKPSTALCRKAGCPDLKVYEWTNPPKKQYYCGITTRIPGNMGTCPKEDPSWV